MIKTCQIYGHNGFDLCVTFNLTEFYKKLGYKTFFSEKIYEVDLLVVIRPKSEALDLSNFNTPVIHVYDYVGNDFDNFANLLDKDRVYIFTTSNAKRENIISKMGIKPNSVYVALPPIEFDLWIYKTKNSTKNDVLVHIGNFKPSTDEDLYRTKFFSFIKNNNINVWGLNWKNESVGGKYKGKSSMFNVSKVYAKTNVALGFMYPFQRDVTFSSRFWQTTLNGCYLLSEPSMYASIIPGIIQTNFEENDIKKALSEVDFTADLKAISKDYWSKEYEKTKKIIIDITSKNTLYNKNRISYWQYIGLTMINFIRKSYQKPAIFNLMNSLKNN